MRSKEVVIGMKVKVHNITWRGTNSTFEQWFANGRGKLYTVHSWQSDEKCWKLKSCSEYSWLLVMAKDFEPYIEEGE